ncbi:uncharacterized protein F54H12.2 [Trichonephila clavipes]|nr:uncharacterized protein F54H12.2 [Trichonephila clavipes]
MRKKKALESLEELPSGLFPPERQIQITSENFIDFTFKRIKYGPDKEPTFKEIIISREQWAVMIEKYFAIENAAIDNMFQCMDFLTAYKTFCEGPIENALPSSLDVSLGQQYLTQILKKSICSHLNEKGLKQPQTFVPNSFGGVEALHRSVKGKYSKKDVKHRLSQKDAYTLHKPVQHSKFQRNRVFVSDIDRQFQADLVDMQSLAEFNKGYKYLLTCIDLFSKFAWAVPLKDKFEKSVKSGLEIIFKERKPKVFQTDVENKISYFKTQLPSPVCLNGEWEVGLSEIIYPHSWLNVNETNNYFLNKVGDGNISSTVKRTIDVGCYETMLDIISAVQLTLPKNRNRFTINYNKATKRVKISAVQGSSLHLENLGELLGFKRNAIIIGNMKSEFVADAWSNFSVFYVYSNIISPQIVGDTQAPLLRIVRTKGKDVETISQYYDRPQYLPLVRHSFQTILSELRLNSGDFVPFERGSGLTHYKGINFQKGYGIGGIFRRLFRAALPFLVKGGKTIGKEVLMTGSRVASDVLSRENFKEAVKTRSRESGKKLAQKAIDRVQSMVGKRQYKRKHSPGCVKSELELFNLPGTQTVIQDGQWKQFHPLSDVFDNAPVEFHISGSAEDYIDLSQTQLYVKAKIVKVDNTPITKDDTIGPVNLFLHSLFSQVDVSLNYRVVSNSSNKVCFFPSCQVIYSQFGLAIHQNDHQARRRFVEWAQNEIAVVPDSHKRILFSDEARFWLNSYVIKQNCRIWSEANPQVYVETPLHPEKLTVLCALWAGGILLQKRRSPLRYSQW